MPYDDFHNIFLEGLKLKDVHQDKRSPEGYLSPEHSEYETGMSIYNFSVLLFMFKVIVFLNIFLDLPIFHPIVISYMLPFQICGHNSQVSHYVISWTVHLLCLNGNIYQAGFYVSFSIARYRHICHPVMVEHLTSLYLQCKKCTDVTFDVLWVVLMAISVFWLMAPLRWYIGTNVSQETTVSVFRVIQEV